MSSERDGSSSQPLYVVWMLMFVAAFSGLMLLAAVGIYYALYGVPTFNEWITVRVPDYSHVAMWKDRVWYSVTKVGPGNFGGQATLMSFDPENGETVESSFKIPFPTHGLLAENDRLWSVNNSAVIRIDGEVLTEFKTNLSLISPSEPFLYEDQLAVIDTSLNGKFSLLVFQDKDWVEIGTVLFPSNLTTQVIDGKPTLVSSATTPGALATADFQFISHKGRLHTFLAEGSFIAYREGLQLASVSALAPENVSEVPDLSDVTGWEVACSVTGQAGIRGQKQWRVGLVHGEPVVVAAPSTNANPFQTASLIAYGRLGGRWNKLADASSPPLLELLAVSNGEQTWVAAQSLMQTLRFLRLTDNSLTPTGALLKAPVTPFQEPIKRWTEIYQWVHWIGLVIMAMGVTLLMSIYRDPQYQFGLTTVMYATFTRRTIARMIDYAIYVIPNYLIAISFGFGSQQQVEQDMDKIFDAGAAGMLVRFVTFAMSTLICSLLVLIVMSWTQGRWGVTLGKWICGIRTVRTTLRPCGFARAMLRELFLAGETLMGATWIPVTLLVALSACRQRAGDMVADTIVIRKPSS